MKEDGGAETIINTGWNQIRNRYDMTDKRVKIDLIRTPGGTD